MAGVPSVFNAMVESLMPKLTGGAPVMSRTREVFRPEGDVAGPLGELAAKYPDLSMGSYPFIRDGAFGTNIVIRGSDTELLDAAMAELDVALDA
jgi:molybdopterin-biosynthesis enzyme MoeA-like protein